MSNDTNIVNRIKTLSFNCQSIKPKLYEIYNYLSYKNIDIACFSETWLKDSDKICLPSYRVYRVDRQSGDHGGVAIAIKSNIKHKHIPPIKTSTIENVAISVDTPSGEIIFISAYFPGTNLSREVLNCFRKDIRLIVSQKKSYYLCGDLNSKHRLWNNMKANSAGIIIYNELITHPFIVMHSPTPTYYPPQRGCKPSNIDIVLTNGLHLTSQVTSSDDLSSDHCAIEFTIDCVANCNQHQDKNFRFDLADWNLFKSSINSNLDLNRPLNSVKDIDNAISALTSACKQAMEISIPKRANKVHNLQLSSDIKNLIAYRNSIKRRIQRSSNRNFTYVYFLNRKIHHKIQEMRNKKWNENLEICDFASKKFWQVTKLAKTKSNVMPPIKTDCNTTLFTNHEKAEEIAKTFYSSHVLTQDMHDQETEDSVTDSIDLISNSRIEQKELASLMTTPKEVNREIRRLKNKKSPGDDGIPNKVLKQFPKRAIIMVTKIYNACLKFSYYPDTWKVAKVIPIPKPNKNLSLASSYRPISLLSSLSKILERIILQRISRYVDENNIIPFEQFGFRAKHSTSHQLLRVVKHVRKQFDHKRSTGMLFLDIEKAFDSLWHNGLLHKLLIDGFQLTLIKLIQSFLKDRKFFVCLQDGRSELFNIPAGAPQGSCLSPALYNIFISDLTIPSDCELAQFADDTGILTSHTNPNVISNRLRISTEAIISYFRKWKIKINTSKTEAIFFTRRRAKRFLPPRKFKFGSTEIEWSKKLKYLGLILDRKLLFGSHIEYTNERAQKYISILYSLISRRSKLNIRNKLLIYKSIIRPILLYACPVWGDCANVHLKKLQVTQNKCLKMIFLLPWHFSTSRLHEIAHTDTISQCISTQSSKFLDNCCLSSNPLISALSA